MSNGFSMATDVKTVQEPITYRDGDRDVSGVVHRLQEAAEAPRPAVAIVQGVAASRSNRSQQVLAALAEAAARVNMVALRLHLREQEPLGYDDQMREAQRALDALAQQHDTDMDHLAIIGPGWGIPVAACLSKHDARVAGVVLWGLARKAGGAGLDRRDDRQMPARPGECEQYYAPAALKGLPAKVLIVHGTSGKALKPRAAQGLARELETAGISADAMVIGDPQATVTGSRQEQLVIAQTIEWLQSVLLMGE